MPNKFNPETSKVIGDLIASDLDIEIAEAEQSDEEGLETIALTLAKALITAYSAGGLG